MTVLDAFVTETPQDVAVAPTALAIDTDASAPATTMANPTVIFDSVRKAFRTLI